MLLPVLLLGLILLFFIAGTIFGIVKWKDPKSGQMVIAGAVCLAVFIMVMALLWYPLTAELRKGGIVDFEHYRFLHDRITPFLLFLPILILLALGITGIVSKRGDSHVFMKFGCFGAFIVTLPTGMTAPGWITPAYRGGESETRSNARKIQVRLEAYEAAEGRYPENIDMIVSSGFMQEFPLNAFTDEPMKDVSYGAPDCFGNFTYFPVRVENEVRGYWLLAYGYKQSEGFTLISQSVEDYVIDVEASNHGGGSIWPEDMSFPELKRVIEDSIGR